MVIPLDLQYATRRSYVGYFLLCLPSCSEVRRKAKLYFETTLVAPRSVAVLNC